MTEKNDSNIKNNYWQMIRGIAIIAVVIIHCRIVDPSIGGGYYYVLRNIVNFPVALFFFISGYFCKFQENSCIRWVRERIRKLIVPYLLWSIIFLFFQTILSGVLPPWTYIKAIVWGKATVPYYYIISLLLFTLITPVLFRALNFKRSCAVFAITPTILVAGYVSLLFDQSVWAYLKYSPIWMLFYYGGMYARRYNVSVSKNIAWLLIPGVLFEIIETCLLLRVNSFSSIAFSQYRITGFVYAFIICGSVLAFSSLEIKSRNILVIVGNESFSIFWIHYGIIIILDKVIPQSFSTPFVLIIELVLAVVVSMIIARLLRHLLKSNCWWFGV